MEIRRDVRDDIGLLHLVGDFDVFEAPLVKESFEWLFERGHARVVLDVGDLEFANSTTLASFIAAQRQARALGGNVVLARAREDLKKTIDVLSLHQIFPMEETVEDALRALMQA